MSQVKSFGGKNRLCSFENYLWTLFIVLAVKISMHCLEIIVDNYRNEITAQARNLF
jgi:hypothetical protein